MIRPLAVTMLMLIGISLPPGANAQATIGPEPPYGDAAQALERWLQAERQEKGVPALSIALVDDQRIVWAQGFGSADPAQGVPATAESVYRVGSVSKLFTDLAIMQLVEQGRLDLDAPVSRYLPEFAPRNPFGTAITLRQLMAHRSGLVREPPVGHYFDPTAPTLAETVGSLNQTELVYAPGTRTKYSNAAITVVGAVVERVRGEPFAASVNRTLLGPLGLRRTSFTPDAALAKGLMWTYDGQTIATPTFPLGIGPAGNLASTVTDLGRFLSVVFAEGRGPSGPILQPETFRRMLEPQLVRPGEKGAFGLGFALSEWEGQRRVGHGGAIYGYATELTALPDEKLGVVVIAAKDCANGWTHHIADVALGMMRAAQRGAPLPEVESTGPVAPERARRLAGRYTQDGRGVDLIDRQGKLFLRPLLGGARIELRALGESLIGDWGLTYGPRVSEKGDQLVIDGKPFDRVPVLAEPPAPAPESWTGLIGEYGWDHDVLYILERDGKLHALIEWFFEYPLEALGPDRFRFPASGLYDGEDLVFTRGADGRATRVNAAGVIFQRRLKDVEDGATFRIEPLRPVAELRGAVRKEQPPREDGTFRAPDLVDLVTLDPTITLDVRYATPNNFLGVPVYSSARAFLQRPAAEALVRAHRKLDARGYGLLIHDAYRPWHITKLFWEATPVASRAFVADPARGSKHNRGAAVDLTLYHRATGQPLVMVGGYDEFSPRSNPDYPGGTSRQRWHRDLLRQTLEAEGFRVNEVEWWHFDHADWDKYPLLNLPFELL